MIVINAVVETNIRGQDATPEFVWEQALSFKAHFPQVLDAKRSLYKYANSPSIGLPFALAIDLETMKVLYTQSGTSTVSKMQQVVSDAFGPDSAN